MYFSNFPKIFYDFSQDQSSTFLQILTDITTNVRVKKQVLENITIYDEYDIQEGETPEIIAEKFYGNPELHWIIMLMNQRYNYLDDFPMTTYELEQYCISTYGADKLNNVHHYERDGVIVEGIGVLKLPNTPSNLATELKVHDFIENEFGRARIESIDAVEKSAVVMIDFGTFKPGQAVTVSGVRTVGGTPVYSQILNFTIPVTGMSLNENYFAVTNQEYEIKLNESKRRIKMLSRSLVDQFVREFNALVKSS